MASIRSFYRAVLASLAIGLQFGSDTQNQKIFAHAPGARNGSNISVTIDKHRQELSVRIAGVELYRWPVSTGASGYSTPAGSFRPVRMEPDHYSTEHDGAPMPHSIFFTLRGHAIHGSFDTERLGSPASRAP
jgi:lipoprotein-anchoring transpeptidase ErfK/SrfK